MLLVLGLTLVEDMSNLPGEASSARWRASTIFSLVCLPAPCYIYLSYWLFLETLHQYDCQQQYYEDPPFILL